MFSGGLSRYFLVAADGSTCSPPPQPEPLLGFISLLTKSIFTLYFSLTVNVSDNEIPVQRCVSDLGRGVQLIY